jgi:hypothetical protein
MFFKAIGEFFLGEIRAGVTRVAVIRKRHVYKFPRFDFGLSMFLYGWLANRDEFKNWHHHQSWLDSPVREHLCPVERKYLFGIVTKMRRSEWPVPESALKPWLEEFGDKIRNACDDQNESNFGILNGKIVCIDYCD